MENLINFFKSLSFSLGRLFHSFLSLIYKENCVVCGAPCAFENRPAIGSKGVQNLCKKCLKDVEILSGFPHTKFDGVEIYSACFYKGVIRDLIHKLKFNHKKDAARVLAVFLYEFYEKIEVYKKECGTSLPPVQSLILVPVPTNKNNIGKRGYNNVFEIVKEFSALSNIPFSKNLLLKVKNTKPQYNLGPKQRKNNVSGCFKINLEDYEKHRGKTFLIIDDIFTTGATLNEIIKTFHKNGIENIFCITLSKAV